MTKRAKAPGPSWPGEICDLLTTIQARFVTAKNREADLVRQRKALEEDLAKKGYSKRDDPEFQELAASLVCVEQLIDGHRADIRDLPNKMADVIGEASGGRHIDAGTYARSVLDALDEPEEAEIDAPLYDGAKGKTIGEPDAGAKTAARADGAAPAHEPAEKAWPAGYTPNPALNAPIKLAEFTPTARKKLTDAGIKTLQDAAALLHEHNGEATGLRAACGAAAAQAVLAEIFGAINATGTSNHPDASKRKRRPVEA